MNYRGFGRRATTRTPVTSVSATTISIGCGIASPPLNELDQDTDPLPTPLPPPDPVILIMIEALAR